VEPVRGRHTPIYRRSHARTICVNNLFLGRTSRTVLFLEMHKFISAYGKKYKFEIVICCRPDQKTELSSVVMMSAMLFELKVKKIFRKYSTATCIKLDP
jgi:hypothetical protein